MAERTGRTIAFEPETAYLVHKFFNKDVNVYVPDFRYNQPWFDELMQHATVITKKEVHENPSKYLIQNTYAHIMELFDLPNQDASYLHSGGTPIGEFDPAYANMQRILKMTGFEHVNFFMSNYFTHAYPPQVKYYCDQVDAKVLIPTHGSNPERLYAKEDRIRLPPELGKTYVMENDRLVEVSK
jgi:ribonuclease J